MMNTTDLLKQLYAEREALERLIVTAELYARGGAPRRGRPPKYLQVHPTPALGNRRSMGQKLRRARERAKAAA